jgi:protein gp37
MADHSNIEWTDATWQPITGCSIVSPGCTNCYAMKLAGGRLRHHPSRKGLTTETKAGPVWNGEVRFNEQWLTQPLAWKKPRNIFVCAHGDLFHEDVPDEWIEQVFAVMALAPQHTFQVLTKRAERMRAFVNGMWGRREALGTLMEQIGGEARAGWYAPEYDGKRGWIGMQIPLPNVWLGVSAERQQEGEERIPHLLQTPAEIRFVSAEPLLGPIDFNALADGAENLNALTGLRENPFGAIVTRRHGTKIDWVIAGGESGVSSRPMHPAWVRSLRDQCAAAGVPFFFKQWGQFTVTYDRDRDDPDWRACDRARIETPTGQWLNHAGGQGFHGERVVRVVPVGKSRAGRTLDGVEHNGMPQVQA